MYLYSAPLRVHEGWRGELAAAALPPAASPASPSATHAGTRAGRPTSVLRAVVLFVFLRPASGLPARRALPQLAANASRRPPRTAETQGRIRPELDVHEGTSGRAEAPVERRKSVDSVRSSYIPPHETPSMWWNRWTKARKVIRRALTSESGGGGDDDYPIGSMRRPQSSASLAARDNIMTPRMVDAYRLERAGSVSGPMHSASLPPGRRRVGAGAARYGPCLLSHGAACLGRCPAADDGRPAAPQHGPAAGGARRLDRRGVDQEPEGPHRLHGCRRRADAAGIAAPGGPAGARRGRRGQARAGLCELRERPERVQRADRLLGEGIALEGQLKAEKRRADGLEAKTLELDTQVRELQGLLADRAAPREIGSIAGAALLGDSDVGQQWKSLGWEIRQCVAAHYPTKRVKDTEPFAGLAGLTPHWALYLRSNDDRSHNLAEAAIWATLYEDVFAKEDCTQLGPLGRRPLRCCATFG